MSHYITCAKCFEPTMDVANLTCSECGYESGMSENKALRELAEQQAKRIKKLEAERDALKQDAERYRWLRQMIFDDRIIVSAARMLHGEALDKAIDAAMKGEA